MRGFITRIVGYDMLLNERVVSVFASLSFSVESTRVRPSGAGRSFSEASTSRLRPLDFLTISLTKIILNLTSSFSAQPCPIRTASSSGSLVLDRNDVCVKNIASEWPVNGDQRYIFIAISMLRAMIEQHFLIHNIS